MLERLKFQMGVLLKTGGLNFVCEDPTTKKTVSVMAVPILYPEDEEVLSSQLSDLLGCQHPNLIKFIDFSVHQIRSFNFRGYTGVNERVAIVLTTQHEGLSVKAYMHKMRHVMTNDDFRALLGQIVNGLMYMHSKGVLHRNLNVDCIIVEVTKEKPQNSAYASKKSATGKAKSKLSISQKWKDIVTCKIGSYWFLTNPRKPGCEYSLGRADWGDRSTLPPEALGMHAEGFEISDKSDVYAFGACAYYWATGGLELPDLQQIKHNVFDTICTNIPIKWGPWIQTLLSMCLQHDPKCRASAKEIFSFLTSRYGKDKGRR